MGNDDRLCDKEDEKLVSVNGSTEKGVGTWLVDVAISCAEPETDWDFCCRVVYVSGDEALFRRCEAVVRECRRGIGAFVARFAIWGLWEGDERTELLGLGDFWLSATFGRGVIICRIRPMTCISLLS